MTGARPCEGRVTACVFDFGGVMTPSLMPELVRPVVAELGVDWNDVVLGYARHRRLMDGDMITMEEMYRRIWAEIGLELSPADLERIVAADRESFIARDEGTLSFMRALKSRGYGIGILTNMPTSFAPYFRRVFADYVALADAVVISGEEHLFKPMREIYDLMKERMGRPAGELCFFDDVEANCQGARDAGWHAIRFLSSVQAGRDFDSLVAGGAP